MKKFSLVLVLLFFFNFSFAYDLASCNPDKSNLCDKNLFVDDCKYKQENCDKCYVEDDEYCIYNQCYFNKHYRIMKTKLSLTQKQESEIDNLYKKFKSDMETLYSRFRVQKNRILEMIDLSNKCYKEEISELTYLKKQMKIRLKRFNNDVEQLLCTGQIKTFNKIKRHEKRKMKKLLKYGAIYKLPCRSCSD